MPFSAGEFHSGHLIELYEAPAVGTSRESPDNLRESESGSGRKLRRSRPPEAASAAQTLE